MYFFCLCSDAVAHLFEAWMPSYAPQMVLLTFVVTKVRPAAGNDKANWRKQLYFSHSKQQRTKLCIKPLFIL
jgi:hypothetical protein